MTAHADTLSEPLLAMSQFYLGEFLPPVYDVRAVYTQARALKDRGISVRQSEERLLKQVVWLMLQIQYDQEEGELHQSLARLAALVLGIIEDGEFSLPEDAYIGSRTALEALAVRLRQEQHQQDMSIGVAIGMYGLAVERMDDLPPLARSLPEQFHTDELREVFRGIGVHLQQGERLLAEQEDAERAAAQRDRFALACRRSVYLLARLLHVDPERDDPDFRARYVRRELKHIELDALGAQRLNEEEQARHTRELLAWTEEDLGEELTDANKAELAERLQVVAADDAAEEEEESGWLFDMD